MSKADLRKAIAGFDAPQLREIILDVYSKSREAKEILDFFAKPDLNKKFDEYLNAIVKEVNRVRHHLPAMRVREIRSLIKKFARLEPGEDAVARLMGEAMIGICGYARHVYIEDEKIPQIETLFTETLNKLHQTLQFEEYYPRLNKAISALNSSNRYSYIGSALSSLLTRAQNGEISDDEDDFFVN